MSSVASLVRALVEADGDVVIFDSGAMPCILARNHQIEVDSGVPEAGQIEASIYGLLPEPQRGALERLGVVQYELPPCLEAPFEQLTLIVVRAGTTFLGEIHRHRNEVPTASPVVALEHPAIADIADIDEVESADVESIASEAVPAVAVAEVPPARAEEPEPAPVADVFPMPAADLESTSLPPASRRISETSRQVAASVLTAVALAPARFLGRGCRAAWLAAGRTLETSGTTLAGLFRREPEDSSDRPFAMDQAREDRDAPVPVAQAISDAAAVSDDDSILSDEIWEDQAPSPPLAAHDLEVGSVPEELFASSSRTPRDFTSRTPRVFSAPTVDADPDGLSLPGADELWPGEEPRVWAGDDRRSASADLEADTADFFGEPRDVHTAATPPPVRHVVQNIRPVTPSPADVPAAIALPDDIVRLLQASAARGASALHLSSQSKPAIRLDSEMVFFDREQRLSAGELESLLRAAIPESLQATMQNGRRVECVSDVDGIGRVPWSASLDRLGVAAIFRLPTAQSATAEDLALSPEVQALALEPEGLILISGSRTSGKSNVIDAIVDLVNRLRRDYVVTIENEIRVAHHSQGSVISQREVRGGGKPLLAAVREALQDDPDVLAIEDVQGDALMRLMLKAAGAGHLVVGGLPARTATAAIEAILDAHPAEHRQRAQAQLSEHLCGVVTQVMLRRPAGGGRIVREVLLNTPEVAKLIASGRTAQLPAAIAAGRQSGMVSLDDELIDLVRRGEVDIHEAYRRTGDRAVFLDLLKSQGIDTSIFEPRR